MYRVLVFIFVVLWTGNFARAETGANITYDTCDFDYNTVFLIADFVANNYTCGAGYYLPANTDACMPCPDGGQCDGGIYSFDATKVQGIKHNSPITKNQNNLCAQSYNAMIAVFAPTKYTCAVGYYLPANADECTLCPAGSKCVGGTYTFNETVPQGIAECVDGYFAPTGSGVCYQHIMQVGDDIVYLRSDKITTPSLNVKIGNDIFYANMTQTRTRMNKDSEHYFRVRWQDNDYYICDDTMCGR